MTWLKPDTGRNLRWIYKGPRGWTFTGDYTITQRLVLIGADLAVSVTVFCVFWLAGRLVFALILGPLMALYLASKATKRLLHKINPTTPLSYHRRVLVGELAAPREHELPITYEVVLTTNEKDSD